MASEFWYVVLNKNKYEKAEKRRRQQEIDSLRKDGLFRVALNNELTLLSNIFEDPTVEAVEIQIDSDKLADFGNTLGYEEMKLFSFRQRKGKADRFIVTRKDVDIL